MYEYIVVYLINLFTSYSTFSKDIGFEQHSSKFFMF
jgi:hypothetical protein